MRWALLLVTVSLAGCKSTGGGGWPSLGRRPGAPAPALASCGAPKTVGCAAPAAPEPAPAPPPAEPTAPSPAVVIDDIPARLNTIDRDLTDLTSRLEQQRTATDAAASAARGAKPDSDAWSKAQLELSRYERAGSAVADLRGRLDAIAGTLAAAAAGGSDVAAPLKATGSLISRASATSADFQKAFAADSAAVSR